MSLRPRLPGAAHAQVARTRMAPGGLSKPYSQSPLRPNGPVNRIRSLGVAAPTAGPTSPLVIRPDALYGSGAVTGGAADNTCRDELDTTYVTVSNTASKTLEFEAAELPEGVTLTGAAITIRVRGTTYPSTGFYTINMYCAENIAPDSTYVPNYGYFVTPPFADPTIELTDDWVDYDLPLLLWAEDPADIVPLSDWEHFTAAVIAGEVQLRMVGQLWAGASPEEVSMDVSQAWLIVTW